MRALFRHVLFLCSLAFGLFLASPSFARTAVPTPGTWGANGTIYDIQTGPDGTTYIGGGFTYVGPYVGSLVPVSTTSSSPYGSYVKVNGNIAALVSDGSGGWFVGGNFTMVGGTARENLAHILSDGTVDPAWDPSPTQQVYALALSQDGTTLYVGGQFTYFFGTPATIGGQPRKRLAAVDTVTGLATSFDPQANNTVYTLATSGTTLYVGGSFTNIGGSGRNHLASFESDTLTSWDPDVTGSSVDAIATSGSLVYIGGSFSDVGFTARTNAAALRSSDGAATSWAPEPDSAVYDILLSGDNVYLAGGFSNAGGAARKYVAQIDDTGAATSWDADVDGDPGNFPRAISLTHSGGNLYIGGVFDTIGGQGRRNLGSVSETTGLYTSWNPTAVDGVNLVFASGTQIMVGGNGSNLMIGGVARNNLAAFDPYYHSLTSWNPNANSEIGVMTISSSTLYVYGTNLTEVGGDARDTIAGISLSTGSSTAFSTALTNADTVYAMKVLGSKLYVGGFFTEIGGVSKQSLAALDLFTGVTDPGWSPEPFGTIYSLATDGTDLFVGGNYSSIGGEAIAHLASVDPATGLADAAWAPSPDSVVTGLNVSGTTLYVGGYFTGIASQSRSGAAALNIADASDTGWDPSPDGGIFDFGFDGSSVIMMGDFNNIGGGAHTFIADVDAGTGVADAWDPGINGGLPSAMTVASSQVFISGSTAVVEGYPNLVIYGTAPTAPAVPGMTVTQSGGTTVLTEGGATDSFMIELDTEPASAVTVTLTPSSQVTISTSTVYFTPSNYNTPVTVTVTAVNDATAEGTHSGTVSFALASGDGDYDGLSVTAVTASITDNDTAGITLTGEDALAVAEGGATDSFTVVLDTPPASAVTFAITPNAQVTVSTSSIYFTSSNYSTPVTVTVTAADDATVEGSHSGSLTYAVTSADGEYDGFTVAASTVTITDNDTAPTNNNGGGGGGGGGGLGSAGVGAVAPVTPTFQTYTYGSTNSSINNTGLPTHALIKLADDGNASTQDDTAVYYIGADGKRHAFPNAKVYFSWYLDFSGVQVVSASQMASIALGKNVTYRPGVRLVKFTTDNKVYAVAKGNMLRWVPSEEVAAALYGTRWNAFVDDIADTFYTNYTFGSSVSGLADFDPAKVRASALFPSDSF